MKPVLNLFFLFYTLFLISACQSPHSPAAEQFAVVLHGGAGTLEPANYTAEEIQAYKDKLSEALDTGFAMLDRGETSLNTVEAVVWIMEDSPLFNAGKGAVFTHDGRNEMDAAIMDGKDLQAGAVAEVGDIRNPIHAARLVMTESPHVLLVGRGASEFARSHGAEMVDSSYFFTERRWESLQEAIRREEEGNTGTVGCVALDRQGNLAAATSTGGMVNKKFGRVGDVPVIGAGTYANNKTCAVSGTGYGEYYIRYTVAHDVSALMEYRGMSLDDAVHEVLFRKVVPAGGYGGLIAVDHQGQIDLAFSTSGMFRGYATSSGRRGIAIFKEEGE